MNVYIVFVVNCFVKRTFGTSVKITIRNLTGEQKLILTKLLRFRPTSTHAMALAIIV